VFVHLVFVTLGTTRVFFDEPLRDALFAVAVSAGQVRRLPCALPHAVVLLLYADGAAFMIVVGPAAAAASARRSSSRRALIARSLISSCVTSWLFWAAV
jgi:hypothetical protein